MVMCLSWGTMTYLGLWCEKAPRWWKFNEACFLSFGELGCRWEHFVFFPLYPGSGGKLIFTIFRQQFLFDPPLYLFLILPFNLPSHFPTLPLCSLFALVSCLRVSHPPGPEESRLLAPVVVRTGRQGEAAENPKQGHAEGDRWHDGGKWHFCSKGIPAEQLCVVVSTCLSSL